MWWVAVRSPATNAGRCRTAVLLVAVAATALKLVIASRTFGTDDVHYWIEFAQGAREFGYVDMYGQDYFAQYNHPPLAGVLLVVANWLFDLGVADLPFLIRVPASVADVLTALLVFELVRSDRTAAQAALASVLVSVSPALITISGFHGNTDPVFVMFVLLSAYLVMRRWACTAGIAFAAALSIKLVPVVVAPVLLIVLVRAGWRRLAAFLGGAAVVAVPLWGPVMLFSGPEFTSNVLGYSGIALREWGLPQFIVWAGIPAEWGDLLAGPGRFVVLLISALAPALLVWRRPTAVGPAVGLALALFLLLSPAFGMQYVVWPLAAAYLISTVAATAYNLAASLFVLSVYSNWNSAPPGGWYEGVAVAFRPEDLLFMVLTWAALAGVVATAVHYALRPPVVDRSPTTPPATSVVAQPTTTG